MKDIYEFEGPIFIIFFYKLKYPKFMVPTCLIHKK